MEADHQTVECDLLLHRGGVALLKVGELGPGVDFRVRQADVGLGGKQLVDAVIKRRCVLGFAIGSLGVRATGHRTRHTQEHLLTLDLGHADDVDALQEIGLVGDRLVKFLGNRGLDAERLAGQLDAIGFSQGDLQGREHFRAVCAQ
ncbi:hypothetical protein BV329_05625 [Pseudomonas syringae pv. actinidiae]|nr:hypothetical protein BV329_05625 [Pseudomonas syringae pv. actinidiae]